MIEFASNPRGWLARQKAAQRRHENKAGDDQATVREQRKQHLAGQKTGTDYVAANEPEELAPGKGKKVKDLSRDELISILVISNVDFSVDLSDQTLRRKLRRHLKVAA